MNEVDWKEKRKIENVFERKILPTKCDLSARFKGTFLRCCQRRKTTILVRHWKKKTVATFFISVLLSL
jgi:hypothetical protein